MKNTFELKEGVKLEDIQMLHPNCIVLLGAFTLYCMENKLPCVVTSIHSDAAKGRVSTSHAEGRAFDARSKEWSWFHIERFMFHMNEKYKNIAAISARDGKPRAVVHHRASWFDYDKQKWRYGAYHFHLQCKP